jgi:hypothetical protein
MTELTFEEFCELPLQYTFGIMFDNSAQRLYRNDKHKLQKEVYTDRNKRTGEWGLGKAYWFLDFNEGSYESVDQVYVAYMEYVCKEKS